MRAFFVLLTDVPLVLLPIYARTAYLPIPLITLAASAATFLNAFHALLQTTAKHVLLVTQFKVVYVCSYAQISTARTASLIHHNALYVSQDFP